MKKNPLTVIPGVDSTVIKVAGGVMLAGGILFTLKYLAVKFFPAALPTVATVDNIAKGGNPQP